MKKLVLPLIAAVAVAAVVIPSLAGAAGTKKTKCHYDQKAVVVTTKVLSGSPPATGANVYAGTVDGSFCGKAMHGAVRGVNHYPTPGKFNGPVQSFGPTGSIKATATGTGTVDSKGNLSFSGKGTITGGTGPFKNATGSFTFTGTQQGGDPDNPAHQHVVGNVKY
jgi:hypothetical protein